MDKKRSSSFNKKHLFYIIPLSLLLIICIIILLIPTIVRWKFLKEIEHVEQKYGIEIGIEEVAFKRYHSLNMLNLSVIQNNCKDTLLHTNQISIDFDWFNHHHFNPTIQNFTMDKLLLMIINKNGYSNFTFLNTTKAKETDKQKESESSLPQKLYHFIETFQQLIPHHFCSNLIQATYLSDSTKTDYIIDSLIFTNGKIGGNLTICINEDISEWNISGDFDIDKQHYAGIIDLKDKDKSVGRIPFFEEKYDLNTSFDTFCFGLDFNFKEHNNTQLTVMGKLLNWHFYNPKVSTSPLVIDSSSFSLNMALRPNIFTIDSTSTIYLNDFAIHPFLQYNTSKTKHITLSINEQHFSINKFIKAMPEEIFTLIPKLGINGNMNFRFLFDCDYADIDNLIFDFNISGEGIEMSEATYSYFNQYNNEFEYTIYEGDSATKNWAIGPSNPYYCPFNQMPPYLMNSILSSEDASFFKHNGFLKSSIRSAMVTNLKNNRFVRGGSTISMQLVKNLFLNRNKVYSRKFEEMLLVWLIESNELITKERMFEIYINIIEWAPSVHGITQAAYFYFDKKPAELTFPECVYLATLIRSPKLYESTLNEDGTLTNARRQEMRYVAKRMLDREMITENELENFNTFIISNITDEKKEEMRSFYVEIDSTLIPQNKRAIK